MVSESDGAVRFDEKECRGEGLGDDVEESLDGLSLARWPSIGPRLESVRHRRSVLRNTGGPDSWPKGLGVIGELVSRWRFWAADTQLHHA